MGGGRGGHIAVMGVDLFQKTLCIVFRTGPARPVRGILRERIGPREHGIQTSVPAIVRELPIQLIDRPDLPFPAGGIVHACKAGKYTDCKKQGEDHDHDCQDPAQGIGMLQRIPGLS